jgi:CheY-like chemotaxis protein
MRRTPATIVVLEQNAAAQELIDQTLRGRGDRILVSNSPEEVLGLASRVRIDLIVGDYGLLEGGDPQMVQQLEAVGHVLFTHVRGVSKLEQFGDDPPLPSPFSLEELRKAVDAALRDLR